MRKIDCLFDINTRYAMRRSVNSRIFSGTKNNRAHGRAPDTMAGMDASPMDDLDRSIIHELERDGRRPVREIARNLQTPEATIRTRMKRLSEAGILRIIAFADPRETGTDQLALVQLTVAPQLHGTVVAALVEMRETTYVSTVLGTSDIVIEIACSDNQELWSILNTKVAAVQGVISMSTSPILQVHKLIYGVPRSR